MYDGIHITEDLLEKRPIFKVVKIIDDYNVVINAGRNYDIEIDDIFEIFITGEEILDPETKESLGTLDTVKARIKVITVYDKMSLCTNAKTSNIIASLGANLLRPYEGTPERLKVDMTQATGGLKKDSIQIKIGDLVRKEL